MNWRSIIKKTLVGIASAVAAAGALVLLPEGAVPVVVVGVAKQIVAWGTTAGVIAGAVGIKGMDSSKPGETIPGTNQKIDREEPK